MKSAVFSNRGISLEIHKDSGVPSGVGSARLQGKTRNRDLLTSGENIWKIVRLCFSRFGLAHTLSHLLYCLLKTATLGANFVPRWGTKCIPLDIVAFEVKNLSQH